MPKELSVSANWKTKYFDKGKEEIFEIYCCPSSIESNRYIITFEDYKTIKRDVPVIFKTEVPVVSTILNIFTVHRIFVLYIQYI